MIEQADGSILINQEAPGKSHNAGFVPLGAQTVWITVLLSVIAGLSSLSFLGGLLMIAFANSGAESFVSVHRIVLLIGGIQLLLFIPASIVFLVWKYRAYKNLDALNVGAREYSAQSAVSSYFIPVMNLFRPFQVMQEIWKGSSPECVDETGWVNEPVSPVVKLWWLLALVKILLIAVTWVILYNPDTLFWEYTVFYCILAAVSDALTIPAVITTIMVSGSVNRRQKEKWAKVSGSSSIL